MHKHTQTKYIHMNIAFIPCKHESNQFQIILYCTRNQGARSSLDELKALRELQDLRDRPDGTAGKPSKTKSSQIKSKSPIAVVENILSILHGAVFNLFLY